MKRHRFAVSVFFFLNGFTYANWPARLPELESFLHISHAKLGTLLFIMAIGAISAMPFSGWIAHLIGGNKVCRFSAILVSITMVFLAVQSNLYIEGVIFFILGLSNGAMDVAMNEQAVLVERMYQKPIMSTFHAYWSIGMSCGAGTGALFSFLHIPLTIHLLIVAFLAFSFFLYYSFHLIVEEPQEQESSVSSFILPKLAIVPLGLISFCCMLSEGSMIDWSAIYTHEVVGGSKSMGALAFGAYGLAMTVGRLLGDSLTIRFGKKRLLILDAVLAIIGLTLLLVFPNLPITLIGLVFLGLGLSTIVPIVYATAGNFPNVSPSIGIAMASTIGYSGFFVGPPVIGYIADLYSLRIGLVFTLSLLVILFLLILNTRFEWEKTHNSQ